MWRKIKVKNLKYDYRINENGEVANFSKYPPKILKPRIMENGYVIIDLYTTEKKRTFTVHKLVKCAFSLRIPEGKIVNHKDGNKLKNTFDNLEWCTYSENNKHAFKTGLRKSTSSIPSFTTEQVQDICILLSKKMKLREIINELELHNIKNVKKKISNIKVRKTYTDISDNYEW